MGGVEDFESHSAQGRVKTKMSLCKLLTQKKTKVGCLKTDSEEENVVDKISSMNSSIFTSPKKTRSTLRGNLTRGYSDPESRTTRLSLCCAVTESSSQTPPHSNHFQIPLHDNGNNNESQKILTKDSGSQTTESNAGGILKPLSESTPIRKVHNNINEKREMVKTEVDELKTEDDLLRQISSCPSSPVRYADEDAESIGSLSSVPSCDSVGLPGIDQSSKRLSVDNLIISPPTPTRQSSPDSVKSAPEVKHRKRKSSYDAKKENKTHLTSFGCDGASHQVSMDSLARQSLLAAQVLHLIPTDKARGRNFLQGRISANSLLGPIELEKVLPKREIKIFIGTWNMNGQAPPSELNDFMLPSCLEHVPDIIAIGTQESYPERFEWEVKIQETIGPSHVLLHSSALGTIHLALFVRRDLLWYCSVPEESSLSVRPGMAFRTKGAVAIAFILFGTSFLFITSHLTAHQDKVKERIHDIKRIVRSLDLPKSLPIKHRIKSKDLTQNFDFVFWFGDLNFRLSQPREDVIHWVEEYKFPLLVDLKTDQLKKLILEGTCLSTFEEASITFPPTYKYDPGTQNFDTSSKQRTPAYTDRILYKSRGGNLSCVSYSSVPSICTSDHKPVWGVYKGLVRPGIDTIPLSAGLFNRDVYLEGIKRRAADLKRRDLGLSAVCSIQ